MASAKKEIISWMLHRNTIFIFMCRTIKKRTNELSELNVSWYASKSWLIIVQSTFNFVFFWSGIENNLPNSLLKKSYVFDRNPSGRNGNDTISLGKKFWFPNQQTHNFPFDVSQPNLDELYSCNEIRSLQFSWWC